MARASDETIANYNLLDMKDRLLKFLNSEQLSSARFAEIIGVQPSSVSHILSGRNNPGFDFIQKLLSSYPSLNAEWLILGKGSMLKIPSPKGEGQRTLFSENESDQNENHPDPFTHENHQSRRIPEDNPGNPGNFTGVTNVTGKSDPVNYKGELSPENSRVTKVNSSKLIEKIIILYSDMSFTEYLPSNKEPASD